MSGYTRIRLADGGGGEATANLIKQVFWSRFSHPELQKGNDAAVLYNPGEKLAISTDSFVVTPWRFPGGDIGKLAICGTINDITMLGANPLGLTVSFIIEEGFPLSDLEVIAQSMADVSREAGAPIVSGDTKVVNKGAADGIFINTTGIGAIPDDIRLGGELARPGDLVLITGSIGDHGAAILLARGEMGITSQLISDVAPLHKMLLPLVNLYPGKIRVLRDPTRGGLATTLNEISRQSNVSIRIFENKIPIKPEVRGVTSLLGIDPLYLANEGKALMIVDKEIAPELINLLKENILGKEATIIGEVQSSNPGLVSMVNEIGGERILHMGAGEQLPRIC